MKRTGMLIALAALTSCWKSGGGSQPPKTVPGDVVVELASVSLGDECPDAVSASDEPAPRSGSMHSSAANRRASSASTPKGSSSHSSQAGLSMDISCIPTAMQLSVRGTGTGEASVRVKKVVLLDGEGKVLANLTPGNPTRWTDDSYVAWNQTVRGGETLNVSYRLHDLDWEKIPGGRWDAQERTFTLRVTLEAGTGERTLEKTASMPKISIEPPAVT